MEISLFSSSVSFQFSIFEEALENPHFDKAVAASMLKTFRSYLDAHETKDKQQREKIRKLEKQLRSTSEFIQKQCDGGLSSGDAKKEVDSLRSNLVSRDAELLRIENELEKQTLEFDRYKSETSKQVCIPHLLLWILAGFVFEGMVW